MSRGSSQVVVSGGSGLLSMLFVLFLALKLIGVPPVAAWSWWWVTAPIWVPLVLVLAIAVVCFVVWLLCTAMTKVWRR